MEATETGTRKFVMGDLEISLGVIVQLPSKEVFAALRRHVRGDRGDLSMTEWEEKKSSLAEDCGLFSAYRANDGTEFWIMTKEDRSATTILLPNETRTMM